MENYKRPESVLVIIVAEKTGRVLMMRRKDDPDFWQSVTGSLEHHENSAAVAALREIKEETGFDPQPNQLHDLSKSIIFEIFPHFRHRYAPDVTHCKEHWFKLVLSDEQTPLLTEHTEFRWLDPQQAAELTKSWSNSQAILEFAV
ncbi:MULTISPECIES: dihydroneopterin triphosphate diphosphatase [Providencia]|uniref:Hydrolase, NUDIX family n=2 Tax=Providencia alcalifaciens TaxID=126385 RepID=B6XI26_9GAMM|nr:MULTISPECIES: dihydroneopterin triphosphate diphosphatase [Providencia]ATG17590.1 dihydroneopterin triphosphate diphosphatase [Providencia alcalifaciens]EEB44989.1 hydrolase, NUDIX family [Providencia alcalifaciens DSM 30120]EKT66102.1 dATP pyrophosphohydrolase [Providencia alcalifaciens Dmel2]ETT05423.1 dihydroneopterin triphosphate pyrophosphatase [Providencia alcalifaciens F90-2004]EUC94574.1 dihydroneopterin triphosphate pyrophosphatase [Providencia alcalifaciens PAL-2]